MENISNHFQRRVQSALFAFLFLVGILGLSLLLEGCSDRCEATREYVYYEPVYTTLEEIRSSVELIAPRTMTQVGKIYIKGSWLFVNAPNEGIHVIDNSNAAQPIARSFISIPGTTDLAVKGNTLYADSYIDLVMIDLSDMNNIHESGRLQNVFTNYNTLGIYLDADRGLITDWVEKNDVKVYESDCDVNIQPWGGFYANDGVAFERSFVTNASTAIAPGIGSGPGVGGSMARFTIKDNYLYTLDGGDVQTIDIESETSPEVIGRTNVAWDMETIFPYGSNLFIGSMTGMHIVDISDPAVPVRVSTYNHVRVCDPVVVQDDLAYVTLRSGNECAGFTNQLEVIDISDVLRPELLEVYPMTNPHGLGIDGSTLFVCDGDDGLKVFDAADITKIDQNKLAHYRNINAFDVIPFNDKLIMIGADGIFQYDYTDPTDIKFLSKIEISSEGN